MADCYIGEIRLFGGTFAPRGWAHCAGALLPINGHDALFSLIGTLYGGDGRTTMGLPDLRSRIPVHQGQGQGLSFRPIGQRYGVEDVTLTLAQLPSHTHALYASQNEADTDHPSGMVLANEAMYQDFDPAGNQDLDSQAIEPTGGNRSHDNVMPYLGMNFIIALQGLYPPRS